MLRIERTSTLTPISGCFSSGNGLLCVEMVDRRFNDLIKLGEDGWSVPCSSCATTVATTVIPSPTTTISPYVPPIMTATPPPLPSEKRSIKRKRQPVRNDIASRLPVRSQATVHRRPHAAIARNLLPRTVNRVTYDRNRTWAKVNRQGSEIKTMQFHTIIPQALRPRLRRY